MIKIVVNRCFGGFSLSQEAKVWISKNFPDTIVDSFDTYGCGMKRDSAALVQCVEALGKNASGRCASLQVVEIPDDVDWDIEEYDGSETIVEKHRKW